MDNTKVNPIKRFVPNLIADIAMRATNEGRGAKTAASAATRVKNALLAYKQDQQLYFLNVGCTYEGEVEVRFKLTPTAEGFGFLLKRGDKDWTVSSITFVQL